MITPRLIRRSLKAAAQGRLLLLWWASLLVPGAIAALPVWRFFSAQLDRSPHAHDVVAFLDGATLIELLRQAGEPAAAPMGYGFVGALLALLAAAPAMAGAMVAAARADEPLLARELLRAAGELYGRMLRLALLAVPVLGLALAGGALALKLAAKAGEKAIWAAQAARQERAAALVALALVFLLHLTLDAGRAQLALQPQRRSAVRAWWSGVRLCLRRPLRVLALGAAGSLAGAALAAALMLVRLRVEQATAARVAAAFLLAQLATMAVGWGKAARLIGLAELARADAAQRTRASGFTLAPPATSPPPPAGVAALSPGTRSGT